jgi:hypothetical protein
MINHPLKHPELYEDPDILHIIAILDILSVLPIW